MSQPFDFAPALAPVAQLATEEAQLMGSPTVRIEHLFTALIRDDHEGGEALAALNVNAERVRAAITKVSEQASSSSDAAFDEQTLSILNDAEVTSSDTPTLALLRKVVHAPSRTLADTFAEIEVGKHQFMREIDRLDVKTDVNAPHSDAVAPGDIRGTKSTTIPASREDVWAALVSPAHFPDWNTSVSEIHNPPTDFEFGAALRATATTANSPLAKFRKSDGAEALIKVIKLEENEAIAFEVSFPDAREKSPHTIEFTLADDAQMTNLTTTVTGHNISTKGVVRSAGPLGSLKIPALRAYFTALAAAFSAGVHGLFEDKDHKTGNAILDLFTLVPTVGKGLLK